MGGKQEKPEDIVLKLRQVEVLQGPGKLWQMLFARLVLQFRHIIAGVKSMAA